MALVQCRECGREISDRALACPQCGDPRRMASSSRGIRILLGVLVGVLVLMFAAGILFAWLAPKASHPIDVEMPQRSDPSAALHMACSPRAACASTPLASR
ncbi:conserved hypothetical protein [Luteimonas sp. 9C]|uniref:zinc-ribbon domain-containing protein n=1 Tax=Luteimonas sp. 9C TaxID=2653148 RepID=UPI0012F08356|nr:zinc-ribbon domain-containing protein [Luteimonas sp. 9C]VXC20959.1 conserved hypothetical protein [Luteimonas sp. 9C]